VKKLCIPGAKDNITLKKMVSTLRGNHCTTTNILRHASGGKGVAIRQLLFDRPPVHPRRKTQVAKSASESHTLMKPLQNYIKGKLFSIVVVRQARFEYLEDECARKRAC
jgi:hypothetical protein